MKHRCCSDCHRNVQTHAPGGADDSRNALCCFGRAVTGACAGFFAGAFAGWVEVLNKM